MVFDVAVFGGGGPNRLASTLKNGAAEVDGRQRREREDGQIDPDF
jgi:hypothetical protein